jgi:hypothetical protein
MVSLGEWPPLGGFRRRTGLASLIGRLPERESPTASRATRPAAARAAPREAGGRPGASAGGLAAAGLLTLALQRFEAHGADHDVVADHVARRAVEAEPLGELEAFLEARARPLRSSCRARSGPRRGRPPWHGERARAVDLAAAGEQLLVEVEILLAGLVLHAHGDADRAASTDAGPSTGNSLSTTRSFGSAFISVIMSASARLQ